MEAGLVSVTPAYPDGFPAAFVAGRTVAVRAFVPGAPVPQGRPRARVVAPAGKKPFVQIYPEAKTREWEEVVADEVFRQLVKTPVDGDQDVVMPFKGRAIVAMRFNMRKPVSYPASVVHHVKKPDVDNLAKSILDGLVKGGILDDDNMVTDLNLKKRYVEDGHPEGVEIDITIVS